MRLSNRNRFLAPAIGALFLNTALAAPFQLLADVYPGPSSGTSQYLVADDGLAFFWGFNGISGLNGQPWASDGTVSGTGQIGEIIGGSGSFWLYQPIFADRGIVYFVANDGFHGRQLWRSDGTFPGTFALTAASGNGLPYDYLYLTPINGIAVFQGGNATDGLAIMGTDGTVVGTQVLLDGAYAATGGVVLEGRALLPNAGTSFIVSDGTPGGTSSFSVPGLSAFSPYGHTLAAVNDRVFFGGVDATHGNELWKTDGTQDGTALLKDIFAGSGSSNPQALMRVDDRLYFIATTPDAGQELWTSDGTPDGTVRVKDIHPGILDSTAGELTALNGVLYFVANSGTTGKELWRSEGTDVTTTLALGDFNALGSNGAFDYTYDTVQAINHKLVLVMDPGAGGSSAVPYVSDGSPGGTSVVDATQSIAINYTGLQPANGRLLASGAILPSSIGAELIATDAFATLGNTWCASPEQAIPDDLPAGLASRFHLPSHGGLAALTVSVDIGHLNVGDLAIRLRHEQTGTEVVLFDRPLDSANAAQHCPGDLLDVVFDDGAGSSVQDTCVDARLAYPRDEAFQPASPLAAFSGESLAGDWTLTAVDAAAGDVGILHEWCMNFATDLIFNADFD